MRREVRGRRRGSMTTLTPSPARPTTSVWTLANNLPLMPSLLAASVQVQHGFLGGAGISFPLRISVLHARAHGEVTCLRGAARGALLAAEVLHTQRASRSQSRAPQTPTPTQTTSLPHGCVSSDYSLPLHDFPDRRAANPCTTSHRHSPSSSTVFERVQVHHCGACSRWMLSRAHR